MDGIQSTSVAVSTEEAGNPDSKFQKMVSERKRGLRRYLWVFLALLGPGLLAAFGDNDAGGIISYAEPGFSLVSGYSFPWCCVFSS